MNNQPQPNEDAATQEPVAPTGLVEALRSIQGPGIAVPKGVDDAVLAEARSYLEETARSRVVPFPRWLAAAAAVVAGLGLILLLSKRELGIPSFARGDVDRNGRVDMLDAFALARKLQAGSVSDLMFDLNGDGTIDQRDIDSIAAQAVKLHKS